MFIDTYLKICKLDPCHCFSLDAMLKMTNAELEKKEEILTLLKDVVKQITNTWKIMILQSHQYTYRILI